MSHNKSRDKNKSVISKRSKEEALHQRICAAYASYNHQFGDQSAYNRRKLAIMEVAKTFRMPIRELRPIINKMRAEKAGMTVAKLEEYDSIRAGQLKAQWEANQNSDNE